jgi:hypothetical protein
MQEYSAHLPVQQTFASGHLKHKGKRDGTSSMSTTAWELLPDTRLEVLLMLLLLLIGIDWELPRLPTGALLLRLLPAAGWEAAGRALVAQAASCLSALCLLSLLASARSPRSTSRCSCMLSGGQNSRPTSTSSLCRYAVPDFKGGAAPQTAACKAASISACIASAAAVPESRMATLKGSWRRMPGEPHRYNTLATFTSTGRELR